MGRSRSLLKRAIHVPLRRFGYEVRRAPAGGSDYPVEFDEDDIEIAEHVLDQQLTMTSRERVVATILACKHVVAQDVPGDFVECGVWRGGCSLAAKQTFERLGSHRHVHLFDTFAGMTEPTDVDTTVHGAHPAIQTYDELAREDHNEWCFASMTEVRANFRSRGVRIDEVHFVEGDVLDTLAEPDNLPERISVLRLDTDWYESTRLELESLYPRLSVGGVLVLDDYGFWHGARTAVEDYFAEHGDRPLMMPTDLEGRTAVKVRPDAAPMER